ncbi:MAG: PEP-CTERM system histidine kinase PrsK [Gammaproteobacteria bacterium]|nr:PEP-CTERM system histidine kinase PrsK [Gammaproteobacteria bacterium]
MILAFVGQQHSSKGKPFFLLIISTLVWSILLAMSQIGASVAFEMIFIAELLRYFTWFYVLHHAMGSYLEHPFKINLSNPSSPFFISLLFFIAALSLLVSPYLVEIYNFKNSNYLQILQILIFTVLGLILVEQLYRNTPKESRWNIIFLCISAGAVFIYDFFVYSNAFLMQQIDYEFWSARGIVNVLIAPTLLISAARNPSLSPNIHISRQFVFHSTTLMGAGLYLIITSLAGYYIKLVSSEWGSLLQITFLFASLLLLFSLFFSSTFKAKIKRYISSNFSNKYDYREEWQRFSNTLLSSDSTMSIHLRSLQAVSQIIDSPGARLWLKDSNQYRLCANWHMPLETPEPEPENSDFINYLRRQTELFTKDEYLNTFKNLSAPNHWFIQSKNSWIILPLWDNETLFGFIHLKGATLPTDLDQEDRELLTTIGHHVALYLSQYEASLALQQAEKFKGINQMTAFLTHDLKTLLSQLFLLVENGKVHKGNPAFIDDMLNTLDHVSQKMQRLIQQLKDPAAFKQDTNFFIINVINEIVDDYKQQSIKPEVFNLTEINPKINANRGELQSAMKHIIQNAVDSVSRQGYVKIELTSNNTDSISINIIDNGKGMSNDFIANRLFQPFDSTKGVSGMGIGVYQSREYIRTLKGDIQVTSIENSGTTFTITLPILKDNK